MAVSGRSEMGATRVLIVDDEADDADLIVGALEDAGLEVCVERVDSEVAMVDALGREAWDVVLTDHSMPGFDSTRALAVLARMESPPPAIVVSGAIGEEATVLVMRGGAADFVSKDRLGRLPGAIQRARSEAAAETERMRLEAELAQARRLESVGRLVGGVAHELNNQLGVILGFGEQIMIGLDEHHPVQPDVQRVLAAGQRSASLIKDLMAFGRMQVLERKPIVAASLAADLEQLLRAALDERVELVIEDDSDRAIVLGDRARLEQALVSLALRGRDAMQNGGTLTIRTVTGGPVGSDAPGDRTVQISVTDTGEGMPAEAQERIFEPFFTTHADGGAAGLAGLGLSVAAGVIAQTGGTISVDSRMGEGTTFVVELPEFDGHTVNDPPAASTPGPESRVLLVEDDDQLRTSYEEMVEKAGYRVVGAANGTHALAILRNGSHKLDLLITDVILPDLDGREVARQAAELRPGLPVVFISGYLAAVSTGLQPGDRLLAKPFTQAELASVLTAATSA